jgi:hypothetical protein
MWQRTKQYNIEQHIILYNVQRVKPQKTKHKAQNHPKKLEVVQNENVTNYSKICKNL